ncbi:hypothetical protein BH10ACI2_BH10ACI2_23750 [soil metagenome]
MKSLKYFLVCSFTLGVAVTAISAQNYKIKQTTTIAGQKIESTIYVKNPRKRTESGGMMGVGGDVATIEQCDLKRNVKVSDKKKQYFVDPFPTTSTETAATTTKTPVAPVAKVTKGGTLTMTSNITDTGERKQMFGLTARHVKTSMKMESSPDACSQSNMQMETDGWYVDLPQFSCPVNISASTIPYQRPPRSGCQDRTIVKETGGGKLGFPLQVTQTMNGGETGNFTQTIDTVEFSKATLDDALFEVPAGYTLAKQEQDLYGRPDFSAMMKAGQDGDDEDKPKSSGVTAKAPTIPGMTMYSPKKPGVKRIGVVAPTNPSGENVSTTNLQSYLVQQLSTGNVEAVPVGNESDARAANCDYILTSDFSKLKQSSASKVGGLFGKITNTDTSAAKSWDIQIDFLLISLPDAKNATKSKAVNKASGDVDRAAESTLAMEAATILAAIK